MIKCPHCEKTVIHGKTCFSLTEYPYPYNRHGKLGNLLQHIDKVICGLCGEFFYEGLRLGSDMEGDNQYYSQVYKYGQYKYRDFSTPVIVASQGVLR